MMNLRLGAFLLWMGISVSGVAATAPASGGTSVTKPRQPVAPPRHDTPGRRWQLGSSSLYLPDASSTGPGTRREPPLTVWAHGAAWVAQQEFYRAGRRGALLCVVTSGSDYRRVFAPGGGFDDMVASATATAANEGIHLTTDTLAIASFSGGWTGPLTLLRHPVWGPRVREVVLADSLYPRTGTTEPLVMDQAALQPFTAFAQLAADQPDRARFRFSFLEPPEAIYRTNTTSRAADALIAAAKLDRTTTAGLRSAWNAPILTRACRGAAMVLGVSGMTTQDHFEHYYHVGDLWADVDFGSARGPSAP